MKTKPRKSALEKDIDNAARFHGHLGPFLVIGVRMGDIAKKVFQNCAKGMPSFQVTLRVPMVPPFSCTIDGIQATTCCTIGNQKLRIENTPGEIVAAFKDADSKRTLFISVNPQTVKELMRRVSEGVGNEELAKQVTCLPENELFTLVKG